MKKSFDQIGGHSGGGGNGVHFDLIGQHGGGGMRGGGFRGGGFRGGFRGGRVVRSFQGPRFRAIDVVPWWPWWGTSWWPYAWQNTFTAFPRQFADACAALGRAVAQGAPQATIDALRAQCAQLVYSQPAPVATPTFGYPGAWPWGTPGYLAY